MDIKKMLAELSAERSRIDRAISALTALEGRTSRTMRAPAGGSNRVRGRRRMSAAGRKKLSLMMKARWAERKRKAKGS